MKAEEKNKKNVSKVEKTTKAANKKTTTSTKNSKAGTKTTTTTKKVETKPKTAKATTKKAEPKKVETKKVETKKTETKKVENKKVEVKKEETKKVENKQKTVKDATLISKKEKLEKDENNKALIKEVFVSNEEAKKVGIVLAIIIGVFCLFFFMTKILKKDDYSDIFVESLDVAEIQYTDILIGNMFKQKENEYYVLIENNDEDIEEITYYAQNYQSLYDKDKDVKLYTAQLNNAFNKKYYGKTDSYEANSLSFSKTTLVKVSNGSIVESYAQQDDIANKLEGLIGTVSY